MIERRRFRFTPAAAGGFEVRDGDTGLSVGGFSGHRRWFGLFQRWQATELPDGSLVFTLRRLLFSPNWAVLDSEDRPLGTIAPTVSRIAVLALVLEQNGQLVATLTGQERGLQILDKSGGWLGRFTNDLLETAPELDDRPPAKILTLAAAFWYSQLR